MTTADGLFHFIDRFCAFGDVNVDGTLRDLEIENVNGSIQVTLRNEIYTIGPSIIWLGVNQYVVLAMWQASQHKDIIEDTNYEWFTPDFIHSTHGVRRTGDYKQIPYNLHYKEPTIEMKYYYNTQLNKRECLIYVCNFEATNDTLEFVTVIANDLTGNEIQIPITLKGFKAELVRVTI
jgi:hypothetical protein